MDLSQRLARAQALAEAAGEMIVAARRDHGFSTRLKQGHELVTDVDLAVDEMIRDGLDRDFPAEARLTEELTPDREALEADGPLWVVDPIDGTVNFAHGLAHVAVSIAWMEHGKARLGVVHAPFLGQTFTAMRGQGAYLNGQRIEASRADTLAHSLVATGFPYRRDSRAPLLRRLAAVLDQCRDVRRNGSAALDLCDVASGRLDAYYESVSPWDFAAGLLIAREAGASVGHLYPCPSGLHEELYGENLLVTAPAIHGALGELLRLADEDRYQPGQDGD
ncbi:MULTISPECIES: inositol monophosphatase family protein [Halomonadaceae]|uniref:inositol monophosphatase family protein n=1 Tax=Halomonas TaxID=2745 RepID=UPI0018A6FBAC|nr:inositol monophosphatase family protein [Halomonas sp. 328]MBF8222063.1 inositol monophosphatase [Halomonas sp. 328]